MTSLLLLVIYYETEPHVRLGHLLKKIYVYFLKLNLLKNFIVIQLQLYAFSPHPSTRPQLNPPPSPTSTLPLDFVHVSFIVVPVIPSSHGPPPPPGYC